MEIGVVLNIILHYLIGSDFQKGFLDYGSRPSAPQLLCVLQVPLFPGNSIKHLLFLPFLWKKIYVLFFRL